MTASEPSSATRRRSPGRGWVVAVVFLVVASAVALGVGPLALATQDPADPTTSIDDDRGAASQDRSVLEGRLDVTDANTTFRGEAANDTFGGALANVGDLNGDGVDDVAIGAPENDTGGVDAGAVFVFYGPVNASTLNASAADVAVYGNQSFAKAGEAIAGADVDGDDVTELVVGAPGDNEAAVGAGAVYVLAAGEDFAANATDDAPATVDLADASTKLLGEGAGDRAGAAVAGVGNRTDGDPDAVLVGAPGNDTAGQNAGAAYLVPDVAGGTTSLGDATTFLGEAARDRAGHDVSTAGDVDGDGDHDVVVGAYRNDSTAENAGAAYVLTGDAFDAEQSLGTATAKLVGAAFRDGAGYAVSNAGDVDDDGYDDVVVGAPFNDTNGNQAGVAYVVAGGPDLEGTVALNASALVRYGEAEGDRAGWAVSSAGSGDVTCDAYADVLVGAPGHDVVVETPWNESDDDALGKVSTIENAGAAYIVAGGETLGEARNLSESQATIRGAGEGDQVGWTVTDVGNATDDRTADVLVGAPFADATANDSGAAYLFDGQCVPAEPEPEPPTTTTPPTTTEPAEPPVVRAESRECEQLTLKNPSSNDRSVRFYVTPEDGLERGPFTLAPGEHGTFADVPPGEYVVRVETKSGGEAVLESNGEDSDVVRVDRCPVPEPEPKGSIRDVDCDDVAIAVRDVAEREVTVQVRFADGSTTREVVETDADGDFAGDVAFANPSGKTVTGVRLFAGAGVDGEELDRASNLEVVCREPAPEPSGAIRDVTCNAVSISVADVPDNQVTVFVRFADGSVTRRIVGIGNDGAFSGDLRYANPRDKDVDAVFLFAGRGSAGEELDRVTRLDVQCREPRPEPEPAGSIGEVSCDAVSVRASDVDADAVTVQVQFADGSTTSASADLDDGAFDGDVAFDNPDDQNVTRVRLLAGSDTSGEVLDDTGRIDVQCREPEPEPAGSIGEVSCEAVSVVASDVDADEVTVQVRFADGSTTTASADLDDGAFDGEIAFENPDDLNVTRVRLLAGDDADGEVLDDTGRIDVQCREPEPEPEPAGSIREVTCGNVSVLASNVESGNVTIEVEFADGTSTTATAATTDGEFDGRIEYENPDAKNVTRVVLYDGDDTDAPILTDSGPVEVTCNEPEPEPEPAGSIREVACGNVSVNASNVSAESVTVLVRLADGSTVNGSAPVADGAFDGEIPFDNPDNQNVTRVQLYAGDEFTGTLLNDTGRIDVTCREPEPEPEPAGSIVDVTCGNVSVLASNVESGNLTIRVAFADGTNATATVATTDGEFDGEIAYDNPDDQNVTRVALYDGNDTDAPILTETGPIEVTCNEPEPVPEPVGSITSVSCGNVSVSAANVSAESVTVLVRLEDGSTVNGSAPVAGGDFDGEIPFANPDDQNVTRVQLYAGDEFTGTLLDDTGPIEVPCSEPEPAPEPVGSIDDVACGNVSVSAANVSAESVTVLVRLADGSTVNGSAPVAGGEFDGDIAFANPDDQNVTRVQLYAGDEVTGTLLDDTGPIEVPCSEPEEETALDPDDLALTAVASTARPTPHAIA